VILIEAGSTVMTTSLPLLNTPSPPERTTLIVFTFTLAGSTFSLRPTEIG